MHRNLQKLQKSSSQGVGMWTRCKHGPCHWLCCPSPVPLARFRKIFPNQYVSNIYFSGFKRLRESFSSSNPYFSGSKRLREGPDKERAMYCQRIQIFVDEALSLVFLPFHDLAHFKTIIHTTLCYSD